MIIDSTQIKKIIRFPIFYLLLIISICSCSINYKNVSIGDKVYFRFMKKTKYNITHGYYKKHYIAKENGVEYQLSLDDKGYVAAVYVYDNTFRTPEGYKVGDSLSKIQSETGLSLIETYWIDYIELASGWQAIFRSPYHFRNSDTDDVFYYRLWPYE